MPDHTILRIDLAKLSVEYAAGVFSWHVHPLRVHMELSVPSYHSVVFTNASFSESSFLFGKRERGSD